MRAFACGPPGWYTSPVFDYTPKARRKPRRWRRLAPVLVGVVAIVGLGSAIAANGPFRPGAADEPGLVAAATGGPASSVERLPDPSATPRPTRSPDPTPERSPTAPAVETLTGYQWPLPNGRLTQPYGVSPWGSGLVDGQKFHDGIDLATFCGDRVVAAHDGVVLVASRKYDDFIGWVGDLTRYKARLDEKKLWMTLPIVVVIDDGNGYRSVYAHFSKVVVKRGATVKAGDFLGYEGMTGHASGCHLHYGVFSPLETATFGLEPTVAKRMKLPLNQIVRIDPLLLLPPRPQDQPSASPSPSASLAVPSPSAAPIAVP
jgi:murein DD-endopeptidase MepM/ murein hydrolase activator NlpD